MSTNDSVSNKTNALVNKTKVEVVVKKDAKENILALKNAGLLRKIFPNQEYREYAKAQLSVVKTELEFRRRALEIARNGQIEDMRKRVNAWVAVQGVAIDKEKERQIRDLIREREQEVNRSIEGFLVEYGESINKTEKMQDGKVKDLETQRLDRVLTDFYGHIDFFKDEFDKSLKFSA